MNDYFVLVVSILALASPMFIWTYDARRASKKHKKFREELKK